MGQNYNSRGIYINWSPLFDYSSLITLEASKKLPIPKGIKIKETVNYTKNSDLTYKLISELSKVSEINEDGILVAKSENDITKVKYLTLLGDLIHVIEDSDGELFTENISDKNYKKALIKTLNYHELYVIPKAISEKAYKNVASANIYNVSHDIRNRDQAYTAISMGLMREAAEQSPKGEQASKLNMLNPLTKYIMQFQNLVGKNVIGIAANGEKIWFNLYYYWTKKLKNGDVSYLKFYQRFNRIQGRGTYLQTKDLKDLSPSTVFHIPDLDLRDSKIKEILIEKFGVNPSEEEYRYTDQLISQLLSAATDNAKELILAKINAGTNFAKMYIYLMMMGYDLNDIAAFMISPAAEFIDTLTSSDFFQGIDSSGKQAISMAEGGIRTDNYLHGVISAEPEDGSSEYEYIEKSKVFRNLVASVIEDNEEIKNFISSNFSVMADFDYKSLSTDELLKYIVKYSVINPESNDYKKLNQDYGDKEFLILYKQIQRIIESIKNTAKKYPNSGEEYFKDVEEFKKVFNLASEISTIASAYLGLNQGLSTDKLSLIKKIGSMKKIISDRESAFGIKLYKLYSESEKVSDKKQKDISDNWNILFAKLQENNHTVIHDLDEVKTIFDKAKEFDIINNFDPVKMLIDSEYRQVARDYLELIKGTVNAIDMLYEIPHYKEILECLKALVVSDKSLSMKSRLIEKLVKDDKNLTDQQLHNIIKYVDNLNIVNFLETLPIVKLSNPTVGFNSFFDKVTVSSFDLGSIEGLSGFKFFVENEFLEFLKSNHKDNLLVRHLVKYENDGKTVLATDIDLLNPDLSSYTKIAYGEIIKGMSRFENVDYNEDYTIADILQIYNILVNKNQYGGERLTTAFKGVSKTDSVLQKFFKFTADNDNDFETTFNFNELDFQINSAEIVPPSRLRYMKDPFVKVKDPVWGYVLKRYIPKSNIYEDHNLLPAEIDQNESYEINAARKTNFLQNSPLEMPERFKIASDKTIFLFKEGENITEDLKIRIKNSLQNLIYSGKIAIIKEC